jgi:hypothetical protein
MRRPVAEWADNVRLQRACRNGEEHAMPFIKLYPLRETEAVRDEDLGRGHPARCPAERRFGAREYYLNVDRIAAFEECPLYLVCAAETDALVNGVRLRLADGATLVVADDPEEGEPGFLAALAQANREGFAEMGYSAYLSEIERRGLI